MSQERLSVRILPDNPDHHIWDNNGTFWFHATLHTPDYQKRRVRVSLNTSHLEVARQRRDALFARYQANPSN